MKTIHSLIIEFQGKKDAAQKEVDTSTNIMDKAIAMGKCSAYLEVLIELTYLSVQEDTKIFAITQEMSN